MTFKPQRHRGASTAGGFPAVGDWRGAEKEILRVTIQQLPVISYGLSLSVFAYWSLLTVRWSLLRG
jgi:hypothetical protein